MPSEVASVGWSWGSRVPCSDHGHHFLDTLNLVRTQNPLCLPYLPSPPDPSLTLPPEQMCWSANFLFIPTFSPKLPSSSCLSIFCPLRTQLPVWPLQSGVLLFLPATCISSSRSSMEIFLLYKHFHVLAPHPSVQSLILQNINHFALRLSFFLLRHLPSFRSFLLPYWGLVSLFLLSLIASWNIYSTYLSSSTIMIFFTSLP